MHVLPSDKILQHLVINKKFGKILQDLDKILLKIFHSECTAPVPGPGSQMNSQWLLCKTSLQTVMPGDKVDTLYWSIYYSMGKVGVFTYGTSGPALIL